MVKDLRDDVQKAREAAVRGAHAARYWEELLSDVFGDIENDYLHAIKATGATESNDREHLYRCVLALHDVRMKLMEYDTYGKNVGVNLENNIDEEIPHEEN